MLATELQRGGANPLAADVAKREPPLKARVLCLEEWKGGPSKGDQKGISAEWVLQPTWT